jgi:O-antigen/teichoic acid export membrane protein
MSVTAEEHAMGVPGRIIRGLRRISAIAYIDLLALLAGVLLLAKADGMLGAVGGIALVYVSGIVFVAVLFRRIGQSERRWSRRPSSRDERGLTGRPADRPHRQGRAA